MGAEAAGPVGPGCKVAAVVVVVQPGPEPAQLIQPQALAEPLLAGLILVFGIQRLVAPAAAGLLFRLEDFPSMAAAAAVEAILLPLLVLAGPASTAAEAAEAERIHRQVGPAGLHFSAALAGPGQLIRVSVRPALNPVVVAVVQRMETLVPAALGEFE
jgi:hypothetical protein